MKFLVLGCNGMAGHLISLYLKEQGHDVLGVARSKTTLVDSIIADAMDKETIKEIIDENRFDSVINCIGLLNQFAENDKSGAVYLNSFFPHFLAQITEKTKTQVIHISTDCVFSGKRGHYTEDDFRDGVSFYDRTKALGEIVDNKNLTLRQSIVGPDIKPTGIGLLNWFMQQEGVVNGYTRAIWTGQTTLQLAKTIEMAAKEKVYGLYNMVPNVSISKYELLKLFNKYLRKEKVTIEPIDRMAADKSLIRTNWDFEYEIPDYDSMVFELGQWIRVHQSLYPHYIL